MPQSALIAFSENIIARTKAAKFASLQPDAAALESAIEQFRSALAASLNGGKAEVAHKNRQLQTLLAALDQITDGIVQYAGDDPAELLAAGLAATQALSRSEQLEAPEIIRIGSTGRKGEIQMQIESAAPNAVLTHGIEYSDDQGQTWKNGSYRSRRRFVLDGLPSAAALLIRVRIIGRADRLSKWSEPALVAVL